MSTNSLEEMVQAMQLKSKADLEKILEKISKVKVNLLLVGGTGVGKSSTINAIFESEKAKVGRGSTPETMGIHCYEMDNMVIWDTPGLGDDIEKDKIHKEQIKNKLQEKDADGNLLIDLVLLILDGASRDYSSAYTLISEVIAPNLGVDKKECEGRLLVAINRADVAKDGDSGYWDHEKNEPTAALMTDLNEKVKTTKDRIKKSTNLDIECIYYCAGYKNEIRERKPYNLAKLLKFILDKIPSKKRISMINDLNQNEENFESNDEGFSFKNIKEIFNDSFVENAKDIMSKTADLLKSAMPIFILIKQGIEVFKKNPDTQSKNNK